MGPRVLVVDNYDSFVYNLVQYLGELGAEPVVHRSDALTIDEIAAIDPDAVLGLGAAAPLLLRGQLSRAALIRRRHPLIAAGRIEQSPSARYSSGFLTAHSIQARSRTRNAADFDTCEPR